MADTSNTKPFSNTTIPSDWEVSTVGDAFKICNNLRLPISEEERFKIKGVYRYYGPTKIQDYINEYRLDGKYALIGEDGDHFLKWKELPMTLLVEGKFNVNNHAHIIKGDKNLTEWFFYYFNNRELTPHLTRQGAGRYKLTKDALSKITILLPSIAEQKAITHALRIIDTSINLTIKIINQKELRKKWLMQNLLVGKIRLDGYNFECHEVRLGKLFDIKKGVQLNKEVLEKSGKYPAINGGISPSGFTDVWNTEANTITISEGGNSCGFVNFFTKRFWCGGHCYALLNPKSDIHKEFIFYLLKYNEEKIMKLRVGSGLPNIQVRGLYDFKLAIPKYEEQKAIAKILQSVDKEIELLKLKTEKLKEQKTGMMHLLLTGKKRLKLT